VLTGDSVYGTALAVSFVVANIASPAGVSGAVLLLPFQVGVLGTPSPAVTPTNLLYNVVATPGALYRYWRQGQTGGRLTRLLVLGRSMTDVPAAGWGRPARGVTRTRAASSII
jgi:uncharacterized membrane protein YfcA